MSPFYTLNILDIVGFFFQRINFVKFLEFLKLKKGENPRWTLLRRIINLTLRTESSPIDKFVVRCEHLFVKLDFGGFLNIYHFLAKFEL